MRFHEPVVNWRSFGDEDSLLALLGFVLALSLAIPFNGDTAEIYDAESNDLAREVQADEKEG